MDRFDAEAVEDREFWWERTYPEPAESEWPRLSVHSRAVRWIARRHAKNPMWRHVGYTVEDVEQLAWIGFVIGIRSWHKRPPHCKSFLSWCIRNATWHINNERQRQAHYSDVESVPRLLLQSSFDEADLAEGGHCTTFETIVERHHESKRPQESDLAVASAAISILRKNDHHRHADVLEARIFDQLTLQEIGDQLYITRERVRQIESVAANKLCHNEEFLKIASEHWPGWNPNNDKGDYQTRKVTIAKKREPRKRQITPAEKLTTMPPKKKLLILKAARQRMRSSGKSPFRQLLELARRATTGV